MLNIKKVFPRGKKGFNDIYIIMVILSILIFTAAFLPFVDQAFGTSSSQFNTEKTFNQIVEDSENVEQFNGFTVLLNLLKLSIWDVGDSLGLPFWLDAFYTILAIILIVTLARNIWIGGGG